DRGPGALDRRARDRDVPEAGHDAAADARGARADPPDGRGARGRGGDAGARGGRPPALRPLAPEFVAYSWSTPTDEGAARAGIDPSQVIRFDQNTSPLPLPSSRPGTIAG